MSSRKTLGKRLRFEIMKRDGFACRYCGANAVGTVLEVDHVLAVANGGTDEPSNLITACRSCNAGKSDVALETRSLEPAPTSADAVREQAEQLQEYMAACKELQKAKAAVAQLVVNHWCDHVDQTGMPRQVYNSLNYWLEALGLEAVLKAVETTGARGYCRNPDRYFIAVVRNMRDRAEAAKQVLS